MPELETPIDAEDVTDSELKELAEAPEVLVGTVFEDNFGEREVVGITTVEKRPRSVLDGEIPAVELTENDFGIDIDVGTEVALGDLFQAIQDGTLSVKDSEVLA